ncbi:LemA family protein [Altererythrobacter arenosus]|uniref:LemA family protein n=1 Tax=Altererythrobacter arenosus TaxID=3032592 RepID=A0ABY8FN77_9SPHN|nr:LemA family protein [Altererythrobacter sp. CAU 1644]WFL76479.1 LemA family protein [Altererythrobacter sp. CAU 1644]
MNFAAVRRFALVAAASLGLAACGINSVPAAEENAKAKWADVEAQFQRRANLIPNLVEVAQGAAENERAILTEVTEARARATSINVSADDLGDAQKMQEFAAAQGQLGQGLGRLLASFEAYPQIQSNQNYLALQSQLEGTENRIAVAIRDYNEAVRQYNTTIRTFPDTIGANIIHGAEPLAPYEAATEGAEVAPTIDMTSN